MYVCMYIYSIYICVHMDVHACVSLYIGGWGGESACDPNREIDFGFVFVYVSCVRSCARGFCCSWGPPNFFVLLLLLLVVLAGGRPAASRR